MKPSTPSLARVDDAVIARRVADTIRQTITDYEWRADRHFDRCQPCRFDRKPCETYDWIERQIADFKWRLRYVAG